jgi:UDP-N-acetylmuramoyl-tripeptide--D-alanyl-D-alanine ligase
VTSISKTPVHVEHYSSPQAVALEKGRLVKALSESGTAILNADDDLVARMVDDFDGKTFTYGMEGADVRIVGLSNVSEDGRPLGINFKLETLGKLLPVGIKGSFGRGQAYASAAALAVASTLGVNLIRASEKLSEYKPLPGRMNLIRGIRDSWLLDDSYNASPIAMEDALNTLKSLKANRKVAILGDMKELGKYSDDAHRKMGKIIASSADILLAVGEKGKVMADSARASGMDERNIHVFDNSDEAKVVAGDIVSSGDLVLIKGSQSMRMERVTAEIMAEPSRAKELLPRQYGNWLDK